MFKNVTFFADFRARNVGSGPARDGLLRPGPHRWRDETGGQMEMQRLRRRVGLPSAAGRQDWIQCWRDAGCPTLKSAEAAFIGFCKARFVRPSGKA